MFKPKSSNYLFLFTAIALLCIGGIFYNLLQINTEKKLVNQLEDALALTKNLLVEQKRYALSLSLLISEDEAFLKSFYKKNRKESFQILNKKIQLLKKLQNSHFEVQVHNEDLTTYIRSWDFNIKDVPLASFRQGLVEVKNRLQPYSSIELGKRLNIKAITPIMKDKIFQGSIEVIINFEYLEKELKKHGYTLYILLDNKFLDIATTLKNNPQIGNYTLVNQTDNSFTHSNISQLEEYGYFTHLDKAYIYFTYYSLKQEKLGYIIVGLNEQTPLLIQNNFHNISPTASKVIIQ